MLVYFFLRFCLTRFWIWGLFLSTPLALAIFNYHNHLDLPRTSQACANLCAHCSAGSPPPPSLHFSYVSRAAIRILSTKLNNSVHHRLSSRRLLIPPLSDILELLNGWSLIICELTAIYLWLQTSFLPAVQLRCRTSGFIHNWAVFVPSFFSRLTGRILIKVNLSFVLSSSYLSSCHAIISTFQSFNLFPFGQFQQFSFYPRKLQLQSGFGY